MLGGRKVNMKERKEMMGRLSACDQKTRNLCAEIKQLFAGQSLQDNGYMDGKTISLKECPRRFLDSFAKFL